MGLTKAHALLSNRIINGTLFHKCVILYHMPDMWYSLKPLQYCKVISLQLIKITEKKLKNLKN